ncbi:MAG: hypothetical protein AB1449_04030 [Chloroflexota bacterium]
METLCGDSGSQTDWREAVLGLAIVLGAWTTLLSEVLGAFGVLERRWIALGWAVLAVAVALALWPRRRLGFSGLRRRGAGGGIARLCLGVTAVEVIVLLVVALAAPPNTNDSLSYHMSRVAHWAQ